MAKEYGLTKDEFMSEAQKLTSDLGFYARRPVRIRLAAGDHIAFTYNTQDTQHVIDVVLNPNCVKDVRNKERARSIVRGIGFHELLHHLHPAEKQYETAVAEGFKPLFNLIDDEQNERRGAADNPTWSAHFQTVCAFIFPTSRRNDGKLSTGIADGGKEEAEEEEESKKGFGAHEAYRQRWNAFAYHLRRHIPADKNTPKYVPEALALIPGNFKELGKPELLELTRSVHQLLATGLTMPPPAKKEEESEEDKKRPAPTASEPTAVPPLIAPGKPFWKTLLNSKWAWGTLAVLVLAWSALFSRGGTGFWFQAAIMVGTIALTAGALLFGLAALRRWLANRKRPDLKMVDRSEQGLVKRSLGRLKDLFARIKLPGIFGEGTLLGKIFRNPFTIKVKDGVVWSFKFSVRTLKYIGAKISYAWHWTWNNRVFRIAMVAMPLAIVLVMLYAVLTRAGEVNWWLAALVFLLLALLLFLAWYFREKLKDFLVGDINMDADLEHPSNFQPPMDLESTDFALIENIEQVEVDDEFLEAALPVVQPLALALRPVLARVGNVPIEKDDEPDGHDVVEDLERAYIGETNLFVDEEERNAASLHIEVGVDCSGSMMSENATLKRGEKFKLAKLFALAIEEATRGQRGISTHFWGFTDDRIFDCGTSGQYRVTGLKTHGGNNDSAMLYHMGKSAAESGKSVKMLFMLSDGQPSDCSWGSLRNLVVRFEAEGMVPWHFALDQIKHSAFEKYFTDLCGQPLEEAILTMVGILAAIAQAK